MATADRLIEVFNEAKSRPVGPERECFLVEVCGDDSTLKEQVLSLLQAHEGAGDFLKNMLAIPPVTILTEKPGDKIGRYKLLQKIGEGGCGVVYMADQEEPVRRRVALKVIKLGMDTKSVIARFEAEGQALALMDHPNIAKVFDAGATETGRPYFVMELVRGIKITEYCDQNNLPTEARLKLFTQVCQAIQHAHQKGIIHRDIKPSNILVTVNDGVPMPKVIDFGIAKAIEQRLTDKTVFTAFEQFIGTPAYMSPEQAEMTSLDIDTRADIYSLGVLLYELLSGNTPFDVQELVASGVAEIRRIIREQEPPKPSTRLNTLNDADLSTVAQRRQTDPPKLVNRIRGDLDWIVMKCLEKDRTRRYETASGLATDIQRHLDNEPVTARPPSNLYRFQKLARRNKLAFAAAGAVTAALIIGLGVSTWMFFREKEARQRAVAAEQAQIRLREEAEVEKNRAQSEATKSKQIAGFLEDMLKGVGPTVARGRDTTLLREILDKTAERVGQELTNQPLVEAELRSTLGETYLRLNEIDKAEAMEREALRLRISTLGENNEPVANSLFDLARALAQKKGINSLALAEDTSRKALAMRRKLLGDDRLEVGMSWALLAGVLQAQGKLDEAESASRNALAIRRNLFGIEHSEVASSLDNLALILSAKGNHPEAEANLKEALTMQRNLMGDGAPDVATSLKYLANVLQREGKLAEAETAYWESWTLRRKLYGDNNAYTTSAFFGLTTALEAQGKRAEAEAMQREHLARVMKDLGNDHPAVLYALGQLGGLLRAQGRVAEAEIIFRERLQRARKITTTNTAEIDTALSSLGDLLLLEEKFAEAEPLLRELQADTEKTSPDHWLAFATRRALGSSLLGQKKYSEAEPLLLSSYEGLTKRNQSPRESLRGLVQLYEATGQSGKAAEWKTKLAEFDKAEAEKKAATPNPYRE